MTLWRLGSVSASSKRSWDGIINSVYVRSGGTITKLNISTDSTSVVSVPGMNPGSVTSSSTEGFFVEPSGSSAKFSFATDTHSNISTTTPIGPFYGYGSSHNDNFAVFSTFNPSSPFQSPVSNALRKFTFATNTVSTIPATRSTGNYDAHVSGPSHSYIAGGRNPAPTVTSARNKFTFSTESVSTLPEGMITGRLECIQFASQTNGHLVAGATGASGRGNATNVHESYAFANDARSSRATIPVNQYGDGGGTSSSNGYMTAGTNSACTTETTTRKYSYSGDSWSVIPGTISGNQSFSKKYWPNLQ